MGTRENRICTRRFACRPGVTLIELLVAVAVVAVLMSITIPAVSGARAAALRTETDSDIRQCVALIASYAASAKGKGPFVEPDVDDAGGESVFAVISVPDVGAVGVPYFAQTYFWHTTLESRGYDTRGVAHAHGPPHPALSTSLFAASQSFLAGPAYWLEDRAQTASMWRIERLSSVRAPSSKAMIYARAADAHGNTSLGFVDGHAARRKRAEAAAWVRNQLWDLDSGPLSTTQRGVRGRDF